MPLSNPWQSLSTASTFDRGDDTRPTVQLGNSGSNNGDCTLAIHAYSSSTSLLIGSLIQQLCTMFEPDAAQRNKLYFAICEILYEQKLIDNSYNMVEFEPLRSQYRQALYRLFTVARAATGGSANNVIRRIPSPLLIAERSRYSEEFKEISLIASGGFGNVFRALHRLDGIEYAVKKITVRSDSAGCGMDRLDEVRTLARLNHANIVPYKGAWMEPTLPSRLQLAPGGARTADGTSGNFSSGDASDGTDTSPAESEENEEGVKMIEENEENSNSISFRGDGDGADGCSESRRADVGQGERDGDRMVLPYVSRTNTERHMTLYIQMALCEKTLQLWMDERVGTTPNGEILAILTQIISGLDYIHSRGIVHHDIKPSNIFISTAGQLEIQLGDFGLACPLRREKHGAVIGTHVYAAPEQLQGKCDPKSDVYSLGIVLVELLVQTKTEMERVEIIDGLKREQIPTSLAIAHPKWVHVVGRLVQHDPGKRPTATQLLSDLGEDKDTVIARLRNGISQRDKLIAALKDRLSTFQQQTAGLDNLHLNDRVNID